jgi:hypothetical protein
MGKFERYKDYSKHITLCEGVDEIPTYYITLPDAPKVELITNFGEPIEKQFFKREVIPDKVLRLNRLPRLEAWAIAKKDKEVMAFIESQWHKRVYGDFQYVFGMPIYLTALNWFYLNYYNMDIGLPKFRYPNTKVFYCWKFCVEDNDKVYGLNELARRRDGKSYRMGAMMLEYITRNASSYGGIQSKSDADATDFFSRSVVHAWRKLPFYYLPIADNSTNPKYKLEFREPRKKIGVEYEPMLMEGEEPLDSWIEAKPSVDTAFDGYKLHRGIIEEPGKMKPPTNPAKIWDKQKPCYMLDDIINGKCWTATTAEEFEKGGLESYLEIWNDSNPSEINELGETRSGLIQYFTPAHDTFLIDQYGFPIADDPLPHQIEHRKKGMSKVDIERGLHKKGAKELLEMRFKAIKDPRKRRDEMRKFARTVKEALQLSSAHCHFNSLIIGDRLEHYIFEPEKGKVRGNFEWKDGQRFSEVIFRPTPNGRWLVSYYPDQERSNQSSVASGKKKPANFDKFVIGADSFKYSNTTSNKPSRGAFYVWAYFDQAVDDGKEEDDYITDDFVCEYLYRPATTDLFAEDVMMTAIYYGCKVNPENNANILWVFFEQHGMSGYLHYGKKLRKEGSRTVVEENKNPGATTLGGAMKDALFASVDWYIETHGHRCKFPNFLESCRDVSYDNISPFDAFVGGAYTLMPVRELKQRPKIEPKSFASFMPMKKY